MARSAGLYIRLLLASTTAILLPGLAFGALSCAPLFVSGSERPKQVLSPVVGQRIQTYHNEVLRLLLGQPNKLHAGPVFDMQKGSFDFQKRALPPLKDPTKTELVQTVQDWLYDFEGPQGFARWLADLTTEVVMESHNSGTLSWGRKQVGHLELGKIVPYQHEYPAPVAVTLERVALPDQMALHRVLDRRIQRFGFHVNAGKVFTEETTATGSQYIGILKDHPDFDVLTKNFLKYVKNHVLFLDRHFLNLPHGQYPHIFQWLYLADRFVARDGEQRGTEEVFAAMDYMMRDGAVGEIVMDHPGQKNPSSPNYITQTAKMILPID